MAAMLGVAGCTGIGAPMAPGARIDTVTVNVPPERREEVLAQFRAFALERKMVCEVPAKRSADLVAQCDHPGGIVVTVTTAGPQVRFAVHSQPPMVMGKQFATIGADEVSRPLAARMRAAFGAAVTER
jgi:hypothetical protein